MTEKNLKVKAMLMVDLINNKKEDSLSTLQVKLLKTDNKSIALDKIKKLDISMVELVEESSVMALLVVDL